MTYEQKQLIEGHILALTAAAASNITISSSHVYVKKLSFEKSTPAWNNDNIITRIENDVANSECIIAHDDAYQFVLRVTIPG